MKIIIPFVITIILSLPANKLPGTSCNSCITIPTKGSGFNYDIDWNNDGTFDQFGVTGTITHDFITPGSYIINIKGDLPHIYFNNSGDKEKLTSIIQWGIIKWKNMENAFYGCKNLTVNAVDAPDLSSVTNMSNMFKWALLIKNLRGIWKVSNITDMSYMFSDAINFNQDLSNWDVSKVTNIEGMFNNCPLFNQDISNWNVSNVTNMSNMFASAIRFNQDLSKWDVSKVTKMDGLFYEAGSFNQDINIWNVSNVTSMISLFQGASNFNKNLNNWNVSKVTDMTAMFYGASSFNQNIGNWDVRNVKNMIYMFDEATVFNQNIASWDVSKVENMQYMFQSASNFNQDISNWDLSKVFTTISMFRNASKFNQNLGKWKIANIFYMSNMFDNCGISTFNYDNMIIEWSNKPVKNNISLGAKNLKYCNSETQRKYLIDNYNWTFNGDTKDCSSVSLEEKLDEKIAIFPNPTTGIITVEGIQNAEIKVYDLLGRKVLENRFKDNKIDISDQPAGIYFIYIQE
ncbi:MAG: BspA family leucine-rich repeat surface protein [Saprospiraceae bacterium]|nr:BspA family leucine-rich repeat surface protein [Saprospiraceae bacterium]